MAELREARLIPKIQRENRRDTIPVSRIKSTLCLEFSCFFWGMVLLQLRYSSRRMPNRAISQSFASWLTRYTIRYGRKWSREYIFPIFGHDATQLWNSCRLVQRGTRSVCKPWGYYSRLAGRLLTRRDSRACFS